MYCGSEENLQERTPAKIVWASVCWIAFSQAFSAAPFAVFRGYRLQNSENSLSASFGERRIFLFALSVSVSLSVSISLSLSPSLSL
jgi:hypothetical protein